MFLHSFAFCRLPNSKYPPAHGRSCPSGETASARIHHHPLRVETPARAAVPSCRLRCQARTKPAPEKPRIASCRLFQTYDPTPDEIGTCSFPCRLPRSLLLEPSSSSTARLAPLLPPCRSRRTCFCCAQGSGQESGWNPAHQPKLCEKTEPDSPVAVERGGFPGFRPFRPPSPERRPRPLAGGHLRRIKLQDQRRFLQQSLPRPLTLAATFACRRPPKKES